jgi:hypothetical protein
MLINFITVDQPSKLAQAIRVIPVYKELCELTNTEDLYQNVSIWVFNGCLLSYSVKILGKHSASNIN